MERCEPQMVEGPSILERIAAGDPSAVPEAFDRYGGLVWSLAKRFTPTYEDAEDAAQDIFLELWSKAARYDRRLASDQKFVAMVARRRLIDRARRRRVRPKSESIEFVLEPADEDTPTPQQALEIEEDAALAAKHFAQLRPEQREVLSLSIYAGWSHREISEHLALPIGTVKTHARRGLLELRARLGVPTVAQAAGAPPGTETD